MSLSSLRFYQTPGVQVLPIVHLNIAASLIAEQFAGREAFLVFEYMEGRTVITDGNDTILATVSHHRFFSKKVWAIYSEEEGVQYYTFLLPEEY